MTTVRLNFIVKSSYSVEPNKVTEHSERSLIFIYILVSHLVVQ